MAENFTEKTAEEQLAEEVQNDFLRMQQERRAIERGWQLNMNFLCGNQYCDVNASGEIYEEDKQYFWQTRRVFNHIAPTVDIRCSKLGRVRPSLTVRAASEEESDIHSASLASAILSAVCEDADLDGIISDATVWSETCGTAFYKIMWDGFAGKAVGTTEDGKKLRQGDVKITAVSPFEIYPYSLSEEKLGMQPAIIHAKAMPVQDIYAAYGVKLAGRDIDEFSLAPYSAACHAKRGDPELKAVRHGYELVIERYEKPTEDRPDGRLTIVAGGKLLYDGILPYINGENGERVYPFIKQTSVQMAGSFFGESVIDRMIPLQRAYNAVKNRKHEFLNRISMGTVAVEDGSVDVDELCEDGLTPGKIIVYRQGGKPPEMLTLGALPQGFAEEEQSLLDEFAKVSGTGDLTRNADSFAGVTSATGLQLIIEQDDEKLENAYQQIKRAVKNIGKHVLRLYRQFASDVRLLKFAGENNVLNLYYFKGSDISSDDVVLEADSEANLTPAQRRTVIYEMLDRGLFSDENGKLASSAKNKVLELLGYEGLAGERDLSGLNRARAGEENLKMKSGNAEVKDYDDHTVHITEHTAFLLTENLSSETEKKICAHIDMHRRKLEEEKTDENDKN
ncbi:MAG: hypothetical protein K2J83_05520 [Clostridia bacterium]|nr:hypothetical protein [Clostridia bacterium]